MAILTSKGVKAPHQLRGVRKVRISRDRRGSGDVSSIENRIDTLEDDVDTITDLVPSDASASNKLVTEKDIHNLEKFTGNLNNLFGYRKSYTCAHYYAMPNDITANAPTVSGMSVSVYYIDVWKDANGFIFQMVRAVGVASNTGVNQTFVRSRFDDGFYPVWGAWQKLVTESDLTSSVTSGSSAPITSGGVYNAIYKTLTRYWNEAGYRFIKLSNAYPTLGLKTNNYIVSCRNDETYLLVCGTTDGEDIVAPQVYLLYSGTGKLASNGFYYDSTTKEIAFMTQGYNAVSVTQISGEVKDIILSELSETNPLSNPVAITPQKLITESDFNYKSGTVNFSCGANLWTVVDVDFDSPMPDTDYVVTLESGNTAYVHVQNVTAKATNGFVIIVWNRDDLTDGRGIINWQAYKIPH